MSTEHIPSLSSIVDQLSARIDGIAETGDPVEVQVLERAREVIVAYVLREDRLASAIDEVLLRVSKEGAA